MLYDIDHVLYVMFIVSLTLKQNVFCKYFCAIIQVMGYKSGDQDNCAFNMFNQFRQNITVKLLMLC